MLSANVVTPIEQVHHRLQRLELDESLLLRLVGEAAAARNAARLRHVGELEMSGCDRLMDRLLQRASLAQAGVRATRKELEQLQASEPSSALAAAG